MRLPDKGKRILDFKERLENEVKKRNELQSVCEVMSGLTVDDKNISENMEWGNRAKSKLDDDDDDDDQRSDSEKDEDLNPLKTLATHSGAGFHKKTFREEKPQEPLIKYSDLADVNVKELKKDPPLTDPFAEILCSKFDVTKSKEKYLPFKSLVHEKTLKNDKIRDITAATPPVSKLANTKLVSLKESLQLQTDQVKNLYHIQMKHAAERLKEKGCFIGDALPPAETTAHYRETQQSESEEEEFDDEAREEPGGVRFPLSNS